MHLVFLVCYLCAKITYSHLLLNTYISGGKLRKKQLRKLGAWRQLRETVPVIKRVDNSAAKRMSSHKEQKREDYRHAHLIACHFTVL